MDKEVVHLLKYFEYGHLPVGPLRETSVKFAHLVESLIEELPDGPELIMGVRKLLEAKDCCVRSALDLVRK